MRDVGGLGDHLGLFELLAQRVRRIGRGARGGQPLRGLLALTCEPRHLGAQLLVPVHRVVDLGDRGRAPRHLGVGGLQAFDRRGPLPVGRPVAVKYR